MVWVWMLTVMTTIAGCTRGLGFSPENQGLLTLPPADTSGGCWMLLRAEGKLSRDPQLLSTIRVVPIGTMVWVSEYTRNLFRVRVGEEWGYLPELAIMWDIRNKQTEEKLNEMIRRGKSREMEALHRAVEEADKMVGEERQRRLKGYGSEKAQKIINHQIWLGMRSLEAEDSLGKPEQVNSTVTVDVVHEQWVYGNGTYLYFDNGILTSWQKQGQ